MNLNDYAREVHAFAVGKGWWRQSLDHRLLSLFEWMREEIDEAEDAWKHEGLAEWCSVDSERLQKPEGLASELVDLLGLVFDVAAGVEIDLEAAWAKKQAYNRVRKYRRDAEGNRSTKKAEGGSNG